jgi:hypothetical protein
MKQSESFSNKTLSLEVHDGTDDISIYWKGKSTEREPGIFLNPILSEALERGLKENKKIIMDFQQLEFMNSSTVTPVAKMLEKGKENKNKITIFYSRGKKWQELSFSALRVFETGDNNIIIIGN